MKRFPRVLTAVMILTASGATALERPALVWTRTFGGGNPYYLNDNTDGTAVLVGQITYGVRSLDIGSNEVHTLPTAGLMPNTDAAKCMVRLGDYYYIANGNAAGVARIEVSDPWTEPWDTNSWAPPPPGAIDPIDPGTGSGIGPESIVTDGTYLYCNNDHTRNRIHCLEVGTPEFTLTNLWSVDLPAGGRVRGMTYDPSGYLYVHNGGDGAGTSFYAINITNRQATLMGSHVEGSVAYQAIRYEDELLVMGQGDAITVYELFSDTELVDSVPRHQYTLGLGDLYGAAMIGDLLFVSHPASVSLFRIPPPGTLMIMKGAPLW